MKPAACNQRIEELSGQIQQLEDRRRTLQESRTSLDLPALKTDFLNEILTNLKGVVEAVPNPQKKHLLQLLLEKVLVKSQRTFEVWYLLPQLSGVRTLGYLVPRNPDSLVVSQFASDASVLLSVPLSNAKLQPAVASNRLAKDHFHFKAEVVTDRSMCIQDIAVRLPFLVLCPLPRNLFRLVVCDHKDMP